MMGTARVAFIGLGRMGLGMAGRLVDAGHDVAVCNRTAGKAAPLTAGGAGLAVRPGAAAEASDATEYAWPIALFPAEDRPAGSLAQLLQGKSSELGVADGVEPRRPNGD
jgi:6-phosphogluconate dehydrogenase (decarboxylating)